MNYSFTFHLPAEVTVENWLRDEWKLGKKLVHELRMQKAVTDEKEEAIRWNETFTKPMKCVISYSFPPSSYAKEEKSNVTVVYEDAHFIIASKPAGMATHPNEEGQHHTFINDVFTYVTNKGHDYAEHVHRLDQGTKGLVLVAKHPIAKTMADRMIEQKEIVRVYEAIVEGVMRQKQGMIRAAIGRDRHHATRRIASKTGQAAVTHFEVVGTHPTFTKVRLILETGRTHQIRVHLSSIGHPIVGDTLYGSKTKQPYYALTAKQMQFIHPFTGEKIVVEDV